MSDFLSDLGGVARSVAGPLVSGGLNLLGGLMQQGGQAQSIRDQEAFQERMSSSAYQRSVADMKLANLNPALMYGAGGPESTPSGASMVPPNVLGGAVQGFDSQASIDADIALKHLEALASSAKLPLAQAEGDFIKSLTPAMKALEGFLSNSAKGVGDLGKVASQGVNSALDLAGDSISDIEKWWHSKGKSQRYDANGKDLFPGLGE